MASYSDFQTDQTFHQFSWPWYRTWPSPNYEWFPWSICNLWLASRERLPFRAPGSVSLLGTCLCSNCWDQIYRTCHIFFLHLKYPSVLSRFCFTAYKKCKGMLLWWIFILRATRLPNMLLKQGCHRMLEHAIEGIVWLIRWSYWIIWCPLSLT